MHGQHTQACWSDEQTVIALQGCAHEQLVALLYGVCRAVHCVTNCFGRLENLVVIPALQQKNCRLELPLISTQPMSARDQSRWTFNWWKRWQQEDTHHEGLVTEKVDLLKIWVEELQAVGFVPSLHREMHGRIIDWSCHLAGCRSCITCRNVLACVLSFNLGKDIKADLAANGVDQAKVLETLSHGLHHGFPAPPQTTSKVFHHCTRSLYQIIYLQDA